jgi:hypothetical protein
LRILLCSCAAISRGRYRGAQFFFAAGADLDFPDFGPSAAAEERAWAIHDVALRDVHSGGTVT